MKKRFLFIVSTSILLIIGCNRNNTAVKDNTTTIQISSTDYTTTTTDDTSPATLNTVYTLEEYYKTVIDFDIMPKDYEDADKASIERLKGLSHNYDAMEYDDRYEMHFYQRAKEEGYNATIYEYDNVKYLLTDRKDLENTTIEYLPVFVREIWVHTADGNYYKFDYKTTDVNNTIHDFVKTKNNAFILEVNEADEKGTWKIIRIDENNNTQIIDAAENYNSSKLSPSLSYSDGKLIYMIGNKDASGNVSHVIRLYDEADNTLTDVINVFNVMNQYMMPVIDNNFIYYMDYDELGWYIFKYDIKSKNITKYHTGEKEVYAHVTNFSVSENYIAYRNYFTELYIYNMITNENKMVDWGAGKLAMSDEACIYSSNGKLFTCRTDDMVVRKLSDDANYFFYNNKRINDKFIGCVSNHATDVEEYFEIVHK